MPFEPIREYVRGNTEFEIDRVALPLAYPSYRRGIGINTGGIGQNQNVGRREVVSADETSGLVRFPPQLSEAHLDELTTKSPAAIDCLMQWGGSHIASQFPPTSETVEEVISFHACCTIAATLSDPFTSSGTLAILHSVQSSW